MPAANPAWPLGSGRAKRRGADLKLVTGPFVFGDRYAETGKASGSAIASRIDGDGMHWPR